MNRYSEYGNDNPAHLSLFYLLSLIIKKDFKIDLSINFKIITLISLFTFLNKVFFILVLFLPIAIWIKKKFYLDKKFLPIFSLFFFSIWIIKNIFISGCAIYPVSISCNNNLSWYSDKPKFIIAANNLSQFSELHAKMWSEIVDDNNSLELNDIIKVLTINPSQILNINKGSLRIGSDADICIFDINFLVDVNLSLYEVVNGIFTTNI